MAVESRNCTSGLLFVINNESLEFNMTDSGQQDPTQVSIAALEARVTELENVVHALAPHNPNAGHDTVVTWLEKIGKRIQGFVRGL